MWYVFKRFLSGKNNTHYTVMYSELFYHCWQCEACEGTKGAFFYCCNTDVCGRRHLGCYHINFSFFPWHRFTWGYMLFNVLPFGTDQSNLVCGFVVYCDFVDCIGRALVSSYRPTVDFLLSKLLYFILAIHFPCISILFDLWSSHLPYVPFSDTGRFCKASFSK